MRFLTVMVMALLVVLGGPALAVQEQGDEHGGSGEHGGRQGEGGEGGGDSEESGARYGKGDTARQARGGVELVMRYDGAAFVGTVRNATRATVRATRVEVHLSNGVELGPTPRLDLAAGETAAVRLDVRGQTFTTWSVHVEVGQAEATPALPVAGAAALAGLVPAAGARRRRAVVAALALAVALGCGDGPTEPSGLEQHGAEGGGESGEGGTRYAPSDAARESRGGVDLEMRYSAGAAEFTGTVTNTTGATVRDVRVEIHLSNGVELGPTARRELAAGEVAAVRLDATGQTFTWWSVHVELGAGSGS